MDETNKSLQQAQAAAIQLNVSLDELNKTLEKLIEEQKDLSKTFESFATVTKTGAESLKQIEDALKKVNLQFDANAKVLNISNGSLEQNKAKLNGLLEQYELLTKEQGDHSSGVKALNTQIGMLSATIDDQEKKLAKSRETFDFHTKSVDALKSSFDTIKGSAGSFGPQLVALSTGFNAMKDGLSVVKTGFTGVGAAIKATGFGLLVLVLQSVTEWLTKSEKGQRVLTVALKGISKVVKVVQDVFMDLGGAIVGALIHPVDTIKSVWTNIIKTITDQLKPFETILEGMFHFNFNQIKEGFTEIGKRISNTASIIVSNVKKAKDGIVGFAKDIQVAFDTEPNATNKKKSTNTNKPKKHQSSSAGSGTTSTRQDLPQAASAGINIAGDDDQQATKQLQQQLNIETKMKIDAANFQKTATGKINDEGNKEKTQAAKEQMQAEVANQKKYVDGLTNVSAKVMSLFGKNTIAARAAFKAHQAAAAAQVIIDTRASIMGIWKANSGLTFIGVAKAIAESAIVAATGASNLSTILKQKPGFAQGGQFVSDGRGALLPGYSRTDNTNAYLRSGEAVVVSEAMRNPWARNLVSAINVAHGGRDFSLSNPGKGYAIGGIFTDGGNANRYYSQPMNDVKDLANTMAYQMINNFPPIYVDVKDVNNQQNILAQTVNRVNL